MMARCPDCGNGVRALGHSPNCPRGKCHSCGGQFPELAAGLCRGCTANPDAPRGHRAPCPPECGCGKHPGRRRDVVRDAAVLICWRAETGSELSFWASFDQAVQAAADLATPKCGPNCSGAHAIAYRDDSGRIRTIEAGRSVDDVHHELRAALDRRPPGAGSAARQPEIRRRKS